MGANLDIWRERGCVSILLIYSIILYLNIRLRLTFPRNLTKISICALVSESRVSRVSVAVFFLWSLSAQYRIGTRVCFLLDFHLPNLVITPQRWMLEVFCSEGVRHGISFEC
jgi:hypothetical protein